MEGLLPRHLIFYRPTHAKQPSSTKKEHDVPCKLPYIIYTYLLFMLVPVQCTDLRNVHSRTGFQDLLGGAVV